MCCTCNALLSEYRELDGEQILNGMQISLLNNFLNAAIYGESLDNILSLSKLDATPGISTVRCGLAQSVSVLYTPRNLSSFGKFGSIAETRGLLAVL